MCAGCGEGKARFKYPGEVHADRDHTLRFERLTGELNRAKAQRLNEPFRTLSPLSASEAGHC